VLYLFSSPPCFFSFFLSKKLKTMGKPKKNANSPQKAVDSSSPPASPSLSSLPKVEKQQVKKAKATKVDKFSADDTHMDASTSTGHFHELFVNIICIAVSVFMVFLCPRHEHDVQKQPNISFFSLYFGGLLDHIDHITQMLLAAGFSLFLDIFVVAFHVLYPPHPKFVLVLKRKISIYLHLTAGITEIVSGVLAFTLSDSDAQRMCATIMSVTSLTHSLTALYQTGVVFGAKGVMVPGYIYAITFHAANAYRLYHNPTSLVYLLHTFLLLHIYVWCRFFIFFFRACNMFEGYHYTISITLSGMLLFPFAVGPIGNFGMLVVVITFCVLESAFSSKTGRALNDKLFKEHERYALITQQQLNLWRNELKASDDEDEDRKAAKAVYDKLHTGTEQGMRVGEIQQMLKSLAIPSLTVKQVLELADVSGDGSLSFNEFYRYIWNIGSVQSRIQKASEKQRGAIVVTDKDKAKLVFEMLDLDNSGYVGLAELDMLLTQWGMPYTESTAFVHKYAGNDKKVSFNEFYTNLRPIWDFAATYVYN
jgi:Ca2+-binding EF-hand superfamily protein